MNWKVIWSSVDSKFHAYEIVNGQIGKELCYEGGPPFRSGIFSYDLLKRNNQCCACKYVWLGYRAMESIIDRYDYPI